MVTEDDKAAFRRLATLSGWTMAEHYRCGYSGDSDPIQHGGFFYDPRDWETGGYASAVEFWLDPEDDDVLHVSYGTVNRPDDMTGAWSSCGVDDPETLASVHAQIDAVSSYCGIELDGTSFPHVKSFRLTDWQEWRIWRSVANWLAALGA